MATDTERYVLCMMGTIHSTITEGGRRKGIDSLPCMSGEGARCSESNRVNRCRVVQGCTTKNGRKKLLFSRAERGSHRRRILHRDLRESDMQGPST